MAVGLLIGIFSLHRLQKVDIHPTFRRTIPITGITITAIAIVPEWLLLPFYFWPDPSDLYRYVSLLPLKFYTSIQPALLIIGSSFCAINGGLLLNIHEQNVDVNTHPSIQFQTMKNRLVMMTPVLFFLLGYLKMSWFGILDRLTQVNEHFFTNEIALAYFALLITVIFFFIASLALLTFSYQVSLLGSSAKAVIGLAYSWLIAIYAVGMICWNLTTRTIPILGELPHWSDDSAWVRVTPVWGPELGIALSFALLFILFGYLIWTLKSNSTDSSCALSTAQLDTNPSNDNSSAWLTERFAEAKLTERELTAVNLFISGKTSAQSGMTMNVKSHTVRTYLQRAYKKLGVNSGKDLVNLANAKSMTYDSHSHDASSAQGNMQTVSYPIRLLAMIALFSLLLPHASVEIAWGVGRDTVCGSVIALLLFGLLMRYRVWLASINIVQSTHHSSQKQQLIQFILGSAIALGLLAFGLNLLCTTPEAYMNYSLPFFTNGLLSFFLTFALCFQFLVAFQIPTHKTVPFHLFYLLLSVCLIMSAILWWLSAENTWMIYLFLAGIYFAASLKIAFFDTRKKQKGIEIAPRSISGTNTRLLFPLFGIICFAFGFMWRTAWLGSQTPLEVIFSLGIIVVLTIYIHQAFIFKQTAIIIAASCGVSIVAFLMSDGSLLFFLAVTLFCMITSEALADNILPTKITYSGLLLVACGCTAGLIIFDAIGDILTYRNHTVVALLNNPDLLKNTVTFASGALLFLILLITGWFCMLLAKQKNLRPVLEVIANESVMQKWIKELHDQGLNDTQTSIAVLITQGYSTKDIELALHFSQGTINSARMAIYKSFSIHSQSELTELFREKYSA